MFDILIGPVRVCRVPPPGVYRFPPRDKPADRWRLSSVGIRRHCDFFCVRPRPRLRAFTSRRFVIFFSEFTRFENCVFFGPKFCERETPTFGPVNAAKHATIKPNRVVFYQNVVIIIYSINAPIDNHTKVYDKILCINIDNKCKTSSN